MMNPRLQAEGKANCLNQRPTMNPYRFAMGVILDRLRWDLTMESFRSRRKVRAWKDRFPNQKAVIVCNGPSLLRTDLDLLSGLFAFGLNKINLLFERNSFRPDVIVALNQLVVEQNADFFNATEIPLFISSYCRKFVRSRENVSFVHTAFQSKFVRDCSVSINEGSTVTVAALQLAFHMGFRDVAVIGCDHNFAVRGPAGATVTSGKVDESHFDPRYFAGGQKWQLPDLAASEYNYSMAAEAYAAFGGRLVNCTIGGNLDLFPRMELAEWVQDRHTVPN